MRRVSQTARIAGSDATWIPRATLGSADYASPEVLADQRERICFGDCISAGRPAPAARSARLLDR